MSPSLLARFERLIAAGIELVPFENITSHFVLARGGYVSLVEKRQEGFGSIGTPGVMTDKGFACLTWRGDQAVFVAKGFEQAATPGQVAEIRKFLADLEAALSH